MTKTKTLMIIFTLLILLVLPINLVFAQCPTMIDTPNELRGELRTIILDFLSDPGKSTNIRDEILDLLDFYKDEKDKSKILDCNALGGRTSAQIYTIMEKTIVFERQCEPEQTRSCGKTDVGVCEFGTQTCGSTYILGPCIGEVRPSDEICDDKDNNCDGETDEDLTRSTNELGACSVNTEICLYGDYVPNNEYTPIPEPACDADNIDNDCDGNEAPTCPSLSLSAIQPSLPADGTLTSTITATTSDSKSNVIISFSSDKAAADTIFPLTCATGADGKCPITVKSLTAGTSTITASAEGYLNGNIELTFTNIKPTAQPIEFTGSNTKGSEIELQCAVNDVNTNDNPVNEKLTVKVWAGQCDPDKCSDTRSWATETGITYYEGIPMDVPETGNIFTKTLTINQEVGTGLAATCLAIDSAGDESTFGDAYQLLTVGCPAASPTFSSITSSSNIAKSGTATITFKASETLIENPKVTIKNKATDSLLGKATFESKNNLDYTYTFTVLNTHINGATKIIIEGKTDTDLCSIGSSIGESNIDTQAPSVSVSHSPSEPKQDDTVTITTTGDDIDKDAYQSSLKEIRIFVDGTLKQTCTASPCTSASSYPAGTHTYYAEIEDNAGNIARNPETGTKSFIVTVPIPVCSAPSLSCLPTGATEIQTSWSAVSDSTNYRLEWCPQGSSFGSSNCGLTTNPDTSALALGLQQSTTYNMRVRAESASICTAPGLWSATAGCATQAEIPIAPAMQVPILVLSYYPLSQGTQNLDPTITGMSDSLTSIRAKVNSLNNDGVNALNQGSIYYGYKDLAAPSLNYNIVDELEYLIKIPLSSNLAWSKPGIFRPDYYNILNDINICDYVDNQGVSQVWMWGYHTDPSQSAASTPYTEPDESNMAMGTISQDYWNFGTYGDVSNSQRINDMPTCQNTYVLYNYNYGRGLGPLLEDHGHQIESLFSFVDTILWSKFRYPYGEPSPAINSCGWTHSGPNTKEEYEPGWTSEITVKSNCEDWHPDGGGEVKDVNCHTWYGATCIANGGIEFKKWWMQNIPGKDNNLVYQGKTLRNWWDFYGDFDAAISEGKSLTS